MVRNFLLLAISLLPLFSFSQTQTVTLNEPAYDERYHKSKLVIPLFKYTSPELEEYQKFGVPVKKAPGKYTIKKLPDMKGVKDTAYGYVFFAGAPSDINEGYITILVCNYRRWFDPAIIYVDRNNNLDFTDDGPADVFALEADYIDISLKNTGNADAAYKVRLSRFSFSKDEQYRKMLDDYYKNNQGNRLFAGVDYSFKENRLNMRGGTYNGETDTFKVALYDGNFDGLYNNGEFDAIYLARPTDTIFFDDYKFTYPDNDLKNAEFEWNFKVYRVTEIDPAGRFVKFYWDKSAQSKRNLKVGKKLPKFKFYLHDAQTQQKIKKFRKKPTYIYFWNTSNPSIDSDTATLRQIHNRFGNCINVVTLNFGDFYKTVSAIKTLDGVPYTMGISNRKINRLFNIEKIPSGYLFKKRLRLYKTGVTPQQMLQMLEEGSKKK